MTAIFGPFHPRPSGPTGARRPRQMVQPAHLAPAPPFRATSAQGAVPGDPHQGFRPRAYDPAPWLLDPDLQTVGGKALRTRALGVAHRTRPIPPRRRHRLETPDGDFLDLEVGEPPRPDAPVVLLLHGLEGSTRRGYMRLAFQEIHKQGMQGVGMNFRSCSGEPNRLPRFYHSGETSDVAHALAWIRREYPGRRVGALGFSLGGNVLLRLLADAEPRVDAAAVISVPFDLAAGTRLLERSPMGRLYTHYFLRSLLAKVKAKAALLAPHLSLDRLARVRTLREFDDLATAPLHGFGSAWEYYHLASSGPVLDRVTTPTVVLHSCDDPFLPEEAIPRDALASNPALLGVVLPRGGHVGFVERSSPLAPRFWAEAEAARYLRGVLEAQTASVPSPLLEAR
jgi:uncharacterized protein